MRSALARCSILVFIIVIAGCAQTLEEPRASSPFSIPATAGNEPRIVATAGQILMITGNPGGDNPQLLVSHDGRTFLPVAVPTAARLPLVGSLVDTDLLVRADGLYVALMWQNSLQVVRSPDNGFTWQPVSVVSSLEGVDRPWLVEGPDEAISVVYFQNGVGEVIASTRDAGVTFEMTAVIPAHQIGCVCSAGRPLADSNGRLLLPFTSNAAPPTVGSAVRVVRSINPSWTAFEGETIQGSERTRGTTGIVSLIEDGSAHVIAAWQGPSSGTESIWLAASRAGEEWGVARPVAAGSLPWLTPIGNGAAVAFLAPGGDGGSKLTVAPFIVCSAGDIRWGAQIAADFVIAAEPVGQSLGDFVGAAADGSGPLYVAAATHSDPPIIGTTTQPEIPSCPA